MRVFFIILLFSLGNLYAQNSTIQLTFEQNCQTVGYKNIDSNSNVLVANKLNGSSSEVIITKIGINQNIIWSKRYSVAYNSQNRAHSFIVDRDNNFVIVGAVIGISSFVLKVNGSNGNVIFTKSVFCKNGSNSDRFFRIYQMGKSFSDDYIVAGTINYPDKHIVARIKSNGTIDWCKELDIDNQQELVYAISEVNNGDILIGGHFKSGNFDHGFIRLDASNGNSINTIKYDISSNGASNGGFDGSVSIKGTNYIAFATIVNGSGIDRQGVVVYNTQTNVIDKIQLYDIGNGARGISIAYNETTEKILLGGAYSNSGNNNVFIEEIDVNDLTKCNTYIFKDIDYGANSTGVGFIDFDKYGDMIASSYYANNSNLNNSKLLYGTFNLSKSNCIKKVSTSMVSSTVPSSSKPTLSIASYPTFGNQNTLVNNADYTLTTLCQDDCIPTKKQFGISTPKSQDTVCYNTAYNLPVNITHNTLASAIKFVLYKMQNGSYMRIDSLTAISNITFSIPFSQAANQYRIIALQKCSFNDTLYFTLIKYQLQAAAPSSSLYLCQNQSISLQSSVQYNGSAAIQYTWKDSATAATLGNANTLNIIAPANKTIFMQASAYCAAPIVATYRLYVAPIVADSLILALHNGCSPLANTLIHPTTVGTANAHSPFVWQWLIGANNLYNTPSEASKAEGNIPHTFAQAGKYTIAVNMRLPNGKICKTYTDTVRVWQTAVAQFYINPAIIDIGDREVQFINQSTNAIAYTWAISDSSFYTANSPIHTLKQAGSFSARLIAYGQRNCNDTLVKTLVVNQEFNVMLPNAFSPNADGVNNVWAPYIAGAHNVEMEIYSRWGELLYKCAGNCAWNGHYKQQLCEDGVYMYILKVRSKKLQTYSYKGTLHLLH